MSKAFSLYRLREISRQRSTRHLQSALLPDEGDKSTGDQRNDRVEWPIPR